MQTIILKNGAYLYSGYSMVGPMEAKGPLRSYFDFCFKDDTLKEKTFEKAERKLLKNIIKGAIQKAGTNIGEIDFLFGGDLLNQIVSSSFAARDLNLPFIGLYSACATMAESLALAAIFIDNNLARNAIAATCTHFSSAERQYRFPLELGNQRPPTAQWTITGGGASVISSLPSNIKISAVTFGKVVDYGIADVNNMGAAMAPAAADTIEEHLLNRNKKASDYDFIATGDLGKLGSEILIDIMERKGIILGRNYADCGCMMYDKTERVFMGGSGAGCSASILNSYIISKLKNGDYKRVLLVSTGALMSTTTSQQGDTIPGIAHAVEFEYCQQGESKDKGTLKSKPQNNKNKPAQSQNEKSSINVDSNKSTAGKAQTRINLNNQSKVTKRTKGGKND